MRTVTENAKRRRIETEAEGAQDEGGDAPVLEQDAGARKVVPMLDAEVAAPELEPAVLPELQPELQPEEDEGGLADGEFACTGLKDAGCGCWWSSGMLSKIVEHNKLLESAEEALKVLNSGRGT